MNPANDIVLLGGGHAHALALPILARGLPAGRKIILVSESESAPYSGMVPGHVAGHYNREECFINLPRLAKKCGAEFIADRAAGLDPENPAALLEKRGALPFGILSINTGGAPNPPSRCFLPEADCAVKPVTRFVAWLDAHQDEDAQIAVVGAGAGGVEVALALDYRARNRWRTPRLTLLDRGDILLPALPQAARERIAGILQDRGITLRLGAEAAERAPGILRLKNGEELAADRAVFATPVGPPPWAQNTGLELSERGFIQVDSRLQTSRPHVFACGDAAHFLPRPLPKSGVFAVKQGPHLARNLLAAARGEAPMEWIPQENTLAILSAGDKRAVAARGRWSAEGAWVWRWKNFLDKRFMSRFA